MIGYFEHGGNTPLGNGTCGKLRAAHNPIVFYNHSRIGTALVIKRGYITVGIFTVNGFTSSNYFGMLELL